MTRWSDEHIIAYLDGKLDMEQGTALHRDRQRDAELDAYISSLEMDTEQLASVSQEMAPDAPMFDFEKTSQNQTAITSVTKTPFWKQTAMAASVLAVFGAGFLTSNLLPHKNPPPSGWVQAVAEYQMLYSGETLALIQKSEDQSAKEVAAIGRKLDIILASSDLKLDGLKLRRGQLLNYKNKPLVQFAYIDGNNTPIAFCIIKRGEKPDQPLKARTMVAGQNAVVWGKGEFAFVVIGKAKPSVINKYAEKLKIRMASL